MSHFNASGANDPKKNHRVFYYEGLPYSQRHKPDHPLQLVREVHRDIEAVKIPLNRAQTLTLLRLLFEIRRQVASGQHGTGEIDLPQWGPRDYPELRGRIPVCRADEPAAWDWITSRLRWLLFSDESQTALARGSAHDRAQLLEGLASIEQTVLYGGVARH